MMPAERRHPLLELHRHHVKEHGSIDSFCRALGERFGWGAPLPRFLAGKVVELAIQGVPVEDIEKQFSPEKKPFHLYGEREEATQKLIARKLRLGPGKKTLAIAVLRRSSSEGLARRGGTGPPPAFEVWLYDGFKQVARLGAAEGIDNERDAQRAALQLAAAHQLNIIHATAIPQVTFQLDLEGRIR